jgi:hypothetical protein
VNSSYSSQDYSDYVGTFDFNAPEVKAPVWPLITSAVFLVASVALILVERSSQGTTLLAVALLGYMLTPLGTAAMLIMAMRNHKTMTSEAGYSDATGKARIKYCSLIAWAGFVVAIPHVVFIASHFSLVFAPGAGS